ncbi:MAG TPA: hypothetical protein VM261_26620 [Kofleriaceae bacterium]|nr:hypothetical protein [Kofleriaceae bacterium]
MRFRLSCVSASLLLLPLAGCPDATPDPVTTACDVTDTADAASLASWRAQAYKTCSLEAIYPHRSGLVSSTELRGEASGWDRNVVLENADANGVRAFSDDRRSFAAFRDFRALGADDRRIQEIPRDADCAPDQLAFAAHVELVDGVCTVSLEGDVVFSAPLHDDMQVSLMSWAGLERDRWPAATMPSNPPALAPGYQYVDLGSMPALDAFERDRRRFAALAGWLGTTPQVVGEHVRFDFELGDELLVPVGGGAPPVIWGDGIATIATMDEAQSLLGARLHAVWHYSGPIEASTRSASLIEITDDAVTYTGAMPRDNARAASSAAECMTRVIERDVAAIVSHRDYTPPLHTAFTTCARLTIDLAGAAAADDRTLARVLALASNGARLRYGHITDTGISFGLGNRKLHDVIGAALVSNARPLAARETSFIVDHAEESWDVLRDRVPLPIARRLAAAVSARAENHFEQVAWELPALPALTRADADAIVRDIATAPDPFAEAFVADLAWRISREPVPAP